MLCRFHSFCNLDEQDRNNCYVWLSALISSILIISCVSEGTCERVGGCLCARCTLDLKWQVADRLKTLSVSETQCPEAFIPPYTPLLNEYSPLPPRYVRQSPQTHVCLWLLLSPGQQFMHSVFLSFLLHQGRQHHLSRRFPGALCFYPQNSSRYQAFFISLTHLTGSPFGEP